MKVDQKQLNTYLKNKVVLVTGGTGSFGQQIVGLLVKLPVKKVVIFSRDEQKQFEMRHKYEDYLGKMDFIIGDVRDEYSLIDATKNVDLIYHCAALKHVPICEDFPLEAIKTNTLAAVSLLKAARANRILKVVVISTDKAVKPVNVMGMTKALQERIVLSDRINADTEFVCVRFGNVIGSRGSVVPAFKDRLLNNKPLIITDKGTTRFLITLAEAAELVFKATLEGKHGQIYIRKAPACWTIDLAMVMAKAVTGQDDYPMKFIGLRHGEQIHESLVSEEEMKRTVEKEDYFLIEPNWTIKDKNIKGRFSDYRSDMVDTYMNQKEIKAQLKKAGWL